MAILSIFLGCSLFSPAHEPVVSSQESYYRIQPESILASLDQNDFEVFVSQNNPEALLNERNTAIHWKQSDFLRIATAFSETIWHEPIDLWDLHSLFLRVTCSDVDKGFEFASIEYFKVLKSGNTESRIRRAMHIDPGANMISVYETEYSPTSMEWNSIDLASLEISADRALEIADKNEGRDARVNVENKCFISASLAPDGFYEGWNIRYSLYGGNTSSATRELLSVYVNERTGAFRVIHPETK